jgi:hypothetical protein
LLLNLEEPGRFDINPWGDRVQLINAKYLGVWELPVVGPVTAPAAVLIRPDGYVAWVGNKTDQGLADALTTWFGPPAAYYTGFPQPIADLGLARASVQVGCGSMASRALCLVSGQSGHTCFTARRKRQELRPLDHIIGIGKQAGRNREVGHPDQTFETM